MEKAKIFQSIVKGSNFFTPIVDSYYTVGNHIVELSCSEKDNWRGRYDKIINGITFKGKYGMECPKVSIVILLKQNHFFKPKQDE